MPAAIGLIAPLMPENGSRRTDAQGTGRGAEFARSMETSGQSGRKKPEDDQGQSGDAGANTAVAGQPAPDAKPSESETTAMRGAGASGEASGRPQSVVLTPHPVAEMGDAQTDETLNADAGTDTDLGDPAKIKLPADAEEIKAGDAAARQAAAATTGAPQTETVQGEVLAADADVAETAEASKQTAQTAANEAAEANDLTGRSTTTADAGDSIETKTSVRATADQDAATPNVGGSKADEKKKEARAETEAPRLASTAAEKADMAARPDLGLATDKAGSEAKQIEDGTVRAAAAADLAQNASNTGQQQAGAEDQRQPDGQAVSMAELADADTAPASGFTLASGEAGAPLAQPTATETATQAATSIAAGAGPAASVPQSAAMAISAPGIGAMMAQAQATVVAAPQELVNVFSDRLSGGDKPDRIMVQLDPPELGRVSIEFKFDAQGLQQVAVRAETAEAMRQLRLLHFDLVQSLEQHGLPSGNMTFSEGFTNGSDQQPSQFMDYTAAPDDYGVQTLATAAMPQMRQPIRIGASGLNIKL